MNAIGLNGVTFVLPLAAVIAVALLLLLHQLDGWIADAVWADGVLSADALTARELAGLVDVSYGTDDMVIVSPRGVELPYSDLWSIDDVMDTLVAVDAL